MKAGATVDQSHAYSKGGSHLVLTAFQIAVFSEQFACANTLLSAGATLDATVASENGTKMLHVVIGLQRLSAARFLVEHGADVNARMSSGHTPLQLAIETGSVDIVQSLLNSGANPNLAGENDILPLTQARRSGKDDIYKILLAAGADD